MEKALELGVDWAFHTGEQKVLTQTKTRIKRRLRMKNSPTQLTFVKTAACPTSLTLLSFRAEKLSRKGASDVWEHLGRCEFCNAELRLLAHHRPARAPRAPEIPMNLRILAESILNQKV